MANFVYNEAARLALANGINWAGDIRAILVMTNTTCGSDRNANFIGDFVTLDECNGAGYARQPLVGEVVNENAGANRAEGKSSTTTVQFTSLGAGTRSNQAFLLYQHVGADAANIPIAYIDTCTGTTFPFNGTGSNVIITMNTNGWIQAQT